MAALLLALLHPLALILLVRLTLPARYALLNPYAAAADALLGRLLAFVRPALRLGDRALCVVLLALDLAACAAVLTRLGGPQLVLAGTAVATFPAFGFLGWFGLAALDFWGFYLALLAGNLILRLWCLGRQLPGFSGDLLCLATRPFSGMRLWVQALAILAFAALYMAVSLAFAAEVSYPLADLAAQIAAQFPGGAHAPAFLAVADHPVPLRVFFLAGMAVLNVIGQLRDYLFLFWLLLALSALMGSQRLAFFLRDVLRLLCGRVPPLRLGLLDLSPLAAMAALLLAHGVLGGLFLLLVGALAHVV